MLQENVIPQMYYFAILFLNNGFVLYLLVFDPFSDYFEFLGTQLFILERFSEILTSFVSKKRQDFEFTFIKIIVIYYS